MHSLAAIFAVIICTWNGNWFPSGRADHRANPEVEAATIAAAGKMLGGGIRRLDPEGREDVIIVVNEVRGPKVARRLAEAVGRTNLNLAVISGYRRRSWTGKPTDRFDMQQDVILTTLPIAGSSWSYFKRQRGIMPPRGYAAADLVVAPAVTARVYAVHFKSNYGATTEEKREDNRSKRALAAAQLVKCERQGAGKAARPVVIAGDFNADRWREEFADERMFGEFDAAAFTNVVAALPPDSRGTHPHKRYGDSSLDAIYLRGGTMRELPFVGDSDGLSDHNPLFVRVDY